MNGATYILIYIRYFNGRKELYMSNNNLEITYKELMELDKSEYQLIDMRSKSALSYHNPFIFQNRKFIIESKRLQMEKK